MSELLLRGVVAKGIGPVEVRFETGLNVVLGSVTADLSTLAELLAGVSPPRAGQISLDGQPLDRRSGREHEVASLLEHEELLSADNVGEAIEHAAALRGSAQSSELMLRDAGLSAFASRKPKHLTPRERRTLALGLALALEPLKLVTLLDPFALSPEVEPRFLVERCRARAERSIVIVLTPYPADAFRLGGRVFWLERGRLEAPRAEGQKTPGMPGLVVRTEAAAALSERLGGAPEVRGVYYDASRAPHELTVRGPDLEALSLCLMRAAEHAGARIESVFPELPALDAVLLARAGWTDVAYHQSPGAKA